jgi:NAD(P)-dependent dehydrogenase (short-subunit alcohol dehydrogenase family)
MERKREKQANLTPVALVTGATGGIGRAIALLLARQGWRVFGASLPPVADETDLTHLALDLTSPQSIQAVVNQVLHQAGRIDALINNAGITGPAAASQEISLEQAHAIFEVNFFGAVALTNAVLPVMRRQNCGKILFISSVGGMVAAMPFFTFYSASKHAIEAYAAGLRLEVRQFNIQVALVEPGYTQTGALAQTAPPAFPDPAYASTRQNTLHLDQVGLRFGTPAAEVAAAALRILRQDRPDLHHLVGSDSVWMVLLSRFLPSVWFERLVYWMFFQWRPRAESGIPTQPRELGLRWILFHRPTRDWTLRAAFSAGISITLAIIMNRLKFRNPGS